MIYFTAPRDFDPVVEGEYEAFLPTIWSDEWHSPEAVTVWVCDPLKAAGESELAKFPNLLLLATPSTGTNHIDFEACARRGVMVVSLLNDRDNLDGISASAEFTFKLLLDCMRMKPAHELQGKRVALIGHGRIGRRVEKYCQAFGASVDWSDPPAGDYLMNPAALFAYADAVIVCCSLTPKTTGMITKELILSMKKNAVLVNTARGEVIDEEGLIEAMQERPDLKVAVDVVSGETTGKANPKRLIELGALVTPHIAGNTYDSRTKAARIILGLIKGVYGNLSKEV